MTLVTTLARKLRHAPVLRRFEGTWNLVRPFYFRLIDPFQHGVKLKLAGHAVRLPPEVITTNADWARYEPETLAALSKWLTAHPRSVLLDLGCSFGVMTSFATQVSSTVQVIAFDSDLTSLRAMDAVVPASALSRVRRVHGLLGSEHLSGLDFDAALESTRQHLPALPPRAAITRSRYLCIENSGALPVPRHQLDALLTNVNFNEPVLLKCDVEGAELLVLQGAPRFLARTKPDLLLSVHPPFLPRHGHSADDVRAFLATAGYSIQLLARDHEEHWWCTQRNR